MKNVISKIEVSQPFRNVISKIENTGGNYSGHLHFVAFHKLGIYFPLHLVTFVIFPELGIDKHFVTFQ